MSSVRSERPIARRAMNRTITAGFSLIELMVAVTIGLFISAALGAVFVNTKAAFTSQDSLAQLQDNQRLALTLLTTSLQLAGYFPTPDLATKQNLLTATTTPVAFSQNSGIFGALAGAGEMIATRYSLVSADSQTSCLGDAPTGTTPTSYVNVFSVSSANVLQCAVNGGAAQDLVSGIASISVLYGVDTSGGTDIPTLYMHPTDVNAGALWRSAKTARVTINFINPYASQSGQPATVAATMIVSLMNNDL